MQIIRQGDVWLYRVEDEDELKERPQSDWREVREYNGHTVLALGEVTGHAHRIRSRRATLRVRSIGSGRGMIPLPARRLAEFPPTRRRVLTVSGTKPVELTHEEHETLTIPPGQWEMRIQREYEPQAISSSRLVYD